jgi:uncharacterized protein involved in exopolysaccharide biosynthesis
MTARGWTGLGVPVLAWFVAVILVTACGVRPPIYRATVKLLVQKTGSGPGAAAAADDSFDATQAAILRSQTILRRAQQRSGLTPLQIAEQLTDLGATRTDQGDILLVTVDSPAPEFARRFADLLAEEYLKFRAEQETNTQEQALLELTREINRLGQELKASDARLAAHVNEHGAAPNAEPELLALRADRDRLQELHYALLEHLTDLSQQTAFATRRVTLLAPATVTEKPRRHVFR